MFLFILRNANIYAVGELSFHFQFLNVCSFGLLILLIVSRKRDVVSSSMFALLDNRDYVLQPNLQSNASVALPVTTCDAEQYLFHFASGNCKRLRSGSDVL